MSSMKGKLNRMKKHLRSEPEKTDSKQTSSAVQPNIDSWERLGAAPCFFEDDYCFVREVTYPLSAMHGKYSLAELQQVVEMWNQTNIEHSLSSKGYQANQLFFFDTETTGLSGVGHSIFLLGHARVYDDKVVVRQQILPGPGHEVAFYHSFLSEVDIKSLVTYNGKAFDWPHVKTRHTLLRNKLPALPSYGHFDLLHGARRLWKHKLDRVSLSNVEQDELEVTRDEDTPGFLAPMLYFSYLKSKDPEILKGVLKHNEEDVLSLITLYIHISKKILNPIRTDEPLETYEMARWMIAHNQTDEAIRQLKNLRHVTFDKTEHANLDLSFLYKKKGYYSEASEIWLSLLAATNLKVRHDAGIELAKYKEHQEKEYESALEITTALLHDYEEAKDLKNEKRIESLKRRQKRLLRKLS
ncbi:ribonuclease H-like domain-containing protein [Bacillus gobiensis]|uniref:ribonuclease H-like domain-containing protein n=1 Tax=Bacillus gobiensis TaxID=1441095 RepID=UPI003D1AF5C7